MKIYVDWSPAAPGEPAPDYDQIVACLDCAQDSGIIERVGSGEWGGKLRFIENDDPENWCDFCTEVA